MVRKNWMLFCFVTSASFFAKISFCTGGYKIQIITECRYEYSTLFYWPSKCVSDKLSTKLSSITTSSSDNQERNAFVSDRSKYYYNLVQTSAQNSKRYLPTNVTSLRKFRPVTMEHHAHYFREEKRWKFGSGCKINLRRPSGCFAKQGSQPFWLLGLP